ncbi:7691_t:CDS:2 [Paraglomus brasilianum]|uniref:mannose-1-phosphate guanylyltransferase n=1 Tax=Paraglomus brasilianum TaxID=144538 RepID=A0A9N8ZBK4_9GLOM|nr:7691_t:CDS:2 [Paraglomus brasilianum]
MTFKAIILVGGPSRGTRFRPLSLDCPKTLFPVAGHPVIWHHLEALSRVDGLREVLLIGFFEASVFESFLFDATREFGDKFHIRYLREYRALGTAGGIYHFRDEIQKGDPQHLFVLNADVACSFPLNEMMSFHTTHRGLCTILGTKVLPEDAHRFGCLVAKPGSNEVLHYVEKPESFISDLISCGIYLFDVAIFNTMKEATQNKASQIALDPYTDSDDKLQLEQDLLRSLAEAHKLYVFETKDFWRQIKTPSSAVPANALYLEQYAQTFPERLAKSEPGGPQIVGAVYIHPTAIVDPRAKIGPNVTIGPRVVISKGVRIKDSIILDNVEIKNFACILHSIIGWDSKIGNWTRIEGTPVINHQTIITHNGVKIQSIAILSKDVTVKDEVVIRNCTVLPHKELKSSFHNEILM